MDRRKVSSTDGKEGVAMYDNCPAHTSGVMVPTTRREFLQSAGSGAFGLSLAGTIPAAARAGKNRQPCRAVILILNVGGPSQLDTWDPKPDAPAEIRGPFRAIRTTVTGIGISELFPRHAALAHHLAFVRSCHHNAPAIHEVGWQLAQTGRDFHADAPLPHLGQVASELLPRQGEIPPHVILPAVVRKRHHRLPTGQSSESHVNTATSATACAMVGTASEPDAIRRRYGETRFAESCLLARQLIEKGVRFVTVNTAVSVFEGDSWDVHGTRPFAAVADMQRTLAPAYDQAYGALIEDLAARGLLSETLVCCVAEFGRTPRINPGGGRDHWPHCWTMYLAGGGIRGGQVIGRSDRCAGEPVERAVHPSEVVATVYHCLGLDIRTPLPAPNNAPLVDFGTEPIAELF